MSESDIAERKCHKCGLTLGFGTMVKAVDLNWHSDCFACFDCNTPIQGEFRVRNPKEQPGRVELLCCPCDDRLRQEALANVPLCKGCGQRITSGKVLAIQGDKFHPECFKCKFCGKPIEGGACLVNNEYSCSPCAQSKQGGGGG
eukprot:CAMPEP_0119132812 /NCGR_PEP_ID=MMETSP1310-20130426/12365_1 /TAXON_ID=464262 /ORGANISM="Genus nov. species nov., Strain RCC2339" /LENGTH=143 /DNA_ID=CAMNT_0007123469 /DNA_START=95 /DNA_END=522 /DNA_ORIENTATION=-